MGSKHLAFVPMIALVLGLDQLGKHHAMAHLGLGERVAILGDGLAMTHVPSVGGAFGVFRDWLPAAQLIGFAALSIMAALVVLVFYRGLARGERGTAAALGAILGAIASNGLDRLRFGAGIDFLHLGPTAADGFPDFNLADVALVLGVATLIIELLAHEMASRAAERPRV